MGGIQPLEMEMKCPILTTPNQSIDTIAQAVGAIGFTTVRWIPGSGLSLHSGEDIPHSPTSNPAPTMRISNEQDCNHVLHLPPRGAGSPVR